MKPFERYLSLWVALCIVTGIVLGHVFPALFQFMGGNEKRPGKYSGSGINLVDDHTHVAQN